MLNLKIGVIIPLFNDSESLLEHLSELNKLDFSGSLSVFVVDDGSVSEISIDSLKNGDFNFNELHLLSLYANVGHQRAIAAGLTYVCSVKRGFDFIVVMDGDGEDRPQDISSLINCAGKEGSVAVARRINRKESLFFRSAYMGYKLLFRLLVGKHIDFGNFCAIPGKYLQRIVWIPEIWYHLSASIVLSRLPIVRVNITRGDRHFGVSKMNFISLVTHGLNAIAVFGDRVFVRMLAVVSIVFLISVTAVCIAIFIRLFTNLAIPGWTTTVIGFGAVAMILVLAFLGMATLLRLGSRPLAIFSPSNEIVKIFKKITTI